MGDLFTDQVAPGRVADGHDTIGADDEQVLARRAELHESDVAARGTHDVDGPWTARQGGGDAESVGVFGQLVPTGDGQGADERRQRAGQVAGAEDGVAVPD